MKTLKAAPQTLNSPISYDYGFSISLMDKALSLIENIFAK
jgi:hypothetical protein